MQFEAAVRDLFRKQVEELDSIIGIQLGDYWPETASVQHLKTTSSRLLPFLAIAYPEK